MKTIFNNLHVFAKLNKTEEDNNKNKTQQILNINKNHDNNSSNNFLTKSFSSDHIFEDYYYMGKKDKESVSNVILIKIVFIIIYKIIEFVHLFILKIFSGKYPYNFL